MKKPSLLKSRRTLGIAAGMADVFGGVRVALALGLPMMVLVMLSLGGGETPSTPSYRIGRLRSWVICAHDHLNNSITSDKRCC